MAVARALQQCQKVAGIVKKQRANYVAQSRQSAVQCQPLRLPALLSLLRYAELLMLGAVDRCTHH